MLHCPFFQTPDALPHDRSTGRVIHVPNTLADVEKQRLQRLQVLAAITNRQPRMEETPDQSNRWKQHRPRRLRTAPAVGVDRFWRIFRINFQRFRLGHTARLWPVFFSMIGNFHRRLMLWSVATGAFGRCKRWCMVYRV